MSRTVRHRWANRSLRGSWKPQFSPIWLQQLQMLLDLPRRPDVTDLLFVDTETTGLSRSTATLPFLIAAGAFDEGGNFSVTQTLLRFPADEAEALDRFAHLFSRQRILITFNGRAFDLALLKNRFRMHRRVFPTAQADIDLLHVSRRVFRSYTSNCRLTTLERQILGIERTEDVDGAQAPFIYRRYLESGVIDGDMERLLHHNYQDVTSMVDLLYMIVRHLMNPLRYGRSSSELLKTAAWHKKRGSLALACACLQKALRLSGDAGTVAADRIRTPTPDEEDEAHRAAGRIAAVRPRSLQQDLGGANEPRHNERLISAHALASLDSLPWRPIRHLAHGYAG